MGEKGIRQFCPLLLALTTIVTVGLKNLAAQVHFIQNPRPTPRRKKHPRINQESPSCQEASPRTILSSAN